MSHVAKIDLSTFDPMDPEIQQCPFDHYAALREHGPIYHDPKTGNYFASRYDVVNEIVRDVETFSSVGSNKKTVGSSEVMRKIDEIRAQGFPRAETMLTTDPPYQTRYRKLVSRTFSARRIASLEDKIREIAIELIDAFPNKGIIDFHADFAVSFPVNVIHYALNMSADTRDKVHQWSEDANAALGVAPSDERRIAAAEGQIETERYWHGEYLDRLANPVDDILSDLTHADFDDPDTPDGQTRKLDFPEVFGIIRQLMVAGNETTTKFLNETIRMLIEEPRWWTALETDPEVTVHGLVEEGLRFSSPTQGLFRFVTRDTEVKGVKIPKGSTIWVMFASANRDESVFDEPNTFDAARPNAKDHLAFGKGHHFCIGAPLSRLEGKVAFEELVKRIKRPAFNENNSFAYEPSFILRGLAELNLNVEKR